MKFVGTRWYKCDFHLHTMYSECYKDKADTPEKWIEEVKKRGLNCVAVTDHNDYRAIDEMKELGKNNNIVVLPGVEVTCDTSKIHVLILFDSNKSGRNVRDFLNKCDIDSDLVGKSDGTSMNVFNVCEQAKGKGALVIAAHIDEYSGINSMSSPNIEKLLDRKYIDAVQVVNQTVWDAYIIDKDKENLLKSLREKYGKSIPFEEADKWRKTYDKAKKAHIPMLSFSDNPCLDGESKHGLWGIGKSYTWLKMGSEPNLESIRQALLSDDMRIRLKNESEFTPETYPSIWIKSIDVENTQLNPYDPLHIEFNPQLNSIIGGRGSGKSSIIRLLAGALNTINTDSLSGIKEEQEKFYKEYARKDNMGIFTKISKIEVCLYRNDVLYKVVVNSIEGTHKQNRLIYKFNDVNNDWEAIDDLNYLDFMKAQVYTQKQIFEIAKETDALLRIIDNAIPDLEKVVNDKDAVYERLLAKMAEIRTNMTVISNESKAKLELTDFDEQINNYKKSGISELLEQKQTYTQEEKIIFDYIEGINSMVTELTNITDKIGLPAVEADELENAKELLELINSNKRIVSKKIEFIKRSIEEISQSNGKLKDEDIYKTKWYSDKENNNINYKIACEKLSKDGMQIEKLDDLLFARKNKQDELEKIEKSKVRLKELCKEKNALYVEYEKLCSKIRKMRTDFIESVLGSQKNVKIDILKYGNKSSFENMIKNTTQKYSVTIDEDIAYLSEIVFEKKGIEEFRTIISDIRNEVDIKSISFMLKKAIRNLDANQYDRMLTFLPEDELSVKYKPEGSKTFISLSTASPGQKTTAILTFILAYGEIPLLLDQPEDDLDNKLVYDLVVKRLKQAKQKRQIIVVTHNANIPVNGDAEFIVSMDSESRYVKVKHEGTLDNENLRKEICDVMEGTEYAFEMRAKKYHLKIVE